MCLRSYYALRFLLANHKLAIDIFDRKNAVFSDVMPYGSCKNIQVDSIIHSHRRDNPKSYIA
jgi:hypothetical protein